MGIDTRNLKARDAGRAISDNLIQLLHRWERFVPNGLSGIGYNSDHIGKLVSGTVPQRKIIDVAPRQPSADDFSLLFEQSMKLF